MENKKIDNFFINFADDLSESVLGSPDEEIMSWAKKYYDDPKAKIDNLRRDIHTLIMGNRREQILLPAKEQYERISNSQAIHKTLIDKGIDGLKELFDNVISQSSEIPNDFVVACRNKDTLTENDILALLEDMYDLGLIDENDI